MTKKICIGKIVAAHGIKGEVKVHSYTDNPMDLDKYGTVKNKDGTKSYKLKSLGMSSSNVRVKIDGINDRNNAENLIGTELYIDRDVLPALEDEEFYQSDIIGLAVRLSEKGNNIGEVVGFSNFGAGDIIEIKINGHKETEMLPFNLQYIPIIDIDGGYIVVSSLTMIFAQDEDEEQSGAES